MEERLFLKQHPRQHAPQTPHIQAVVISHIVQQQLWALEVSTSHSHIVLCVLVVKLCESSVYESELPLVVVDHDVVWLDVSMDDSLAVTVIEGLQHFVHVEANVKVCEGGEKLFEVDVVDVLKYEAGSLALRVSHNVNQLYDVHSAIQVLQDLDFPFDLLLFDWLENFDADGLVVCHINSFVDIAVFSSPYFSDDFIIVLPSSLDGDVVIVGVLF